MANTVNYVSYSHVGGGSQDFEFRFVVTFTGSYVNGTGETVNFTTAANPNGLELNAFLPATTLPETVPDFTDNLGAYGVVCGAYSAGSVNIKFQSAAGTELGSGAYPATITGGQITFNIRNRG